MKRFLSLLSVSLMAVPVLASAASASDLLSRLRAVQGSSFSVDAHTYQDGTYVSAWASGSMSLVSPVTGFDATIDHMENDRRSRLKGTVRIIPEGVYVRFTSRDGIFAEESNLISSLPIGTWIQVIPAPGSTELLSNGDWFTAFSGVEENADSIFTVQEVPSGTGTNYIVQLMPDAAAALAEKVLDGLGGDRPVVQDFFPWRAFAESTFFESVLRSNANGDLTERKTTLHVTGSRSGLRVEADEKLLATAPTWPAPEGAVTIGDLIPLTDFMFFGISSLGTVETEFSFDAFPVSVFSEFSFEDIDADVSLNSVSSVTPLHCRNEEGIRLVGLHRSGACPVEWVSRRNLTRVP